MAVHPELERKMPAFENLPWIPGANQLLEAMIRGREAGLQQQQIQNQASAEAARTALGYAGLHTKEEIGQMKNEEVANALDQKTQQSNERESRLGARESTLEDEADSRLAFRQSQQDALEQYRQSLMDQKGSVQRISPGDSIARDVALKQYEEGLKLESDAPGSGQTLIQQSKQVLDGLSQKYQPQAQPQSGASMPESSPFQPQPLTSSQLPGATIDSGSLAASSLGLGGSGQRLGDVGQGSTPNAPQMPPEGSIVKRKSDGATGTVVNGQFVWHQGPGKTYMGDYQNSPDSEAGGPGAQAAPGQ